MLETPAYFKRLSFTWLAFFSIIGGPIAYQTFDPAAQARWGLPSSSHLPKCSFRSKTDLHKAFSCRI